MKKAECSLKDIDYIAVTNTPGLIGSLLVGLMFAKSLSYANSVVANESYKWTYIFKFY